MIPRQSRSVGAARALIVGVGLASLLSAQAFSAGPTSIPWRQDFAQAEREAKAQNRPLWVQFTGPWCHFCTRLEQETLVHPKIVEHARGSFVPVKLQSDVHEDLALRYGLTGLPATIIVKPSGEVLAKQEGFLDAPGFHAFLSASLARFEPAHAVAGKPKPVDPVALSGFSPVSLVADRKLVRGREAVRLQHGGRLYQFADEAERNRFQKQPERFVPVNGGRCPVNQVDRGESRQGDPHWGALYQGHLYLCADGTSRQDFLTHPERYAHVDVADRGFCPHCWTRDALLVRGKPEYSLSRDGRRFYFPDMTHLEAFRSSPETSRR